MLYTDSRAPCCGTERGISNWFHTTTFFLLSSLAVRSSSVFCTSWLDNVLLSGTTSLSSASSRSCSSWSMALSRFLRCSRLAFFSSFSLCSWNADILTKQWGKKTWVVFLVSLSGICLLMKLADREHTKDKVLQDYAFMVSSYYSPSHTHTYTYHCTFMDNT